MRQNRNGGKVRPSPHGTGSLMTVSGPNPRRLFLKAGIASLGALALWLMNSLAKRAEVSPENAESLLTVPLVAGNGIRFYDRAIVISDGQRLAVFSPTCPHLGCRINRAEGSQIVCPCHGSRFSTQGEVLSGPARRGLRPLRFELDQAAAKLRITLNNEQS
jgi:nitrite reductase/ring-hydroxylating ferredoxin subunit